MRKWNTRMFLLCDIMTKSGLKQSKLKKSLKWNTENIFATKKCIDESHGDRTSILCLEYTIYAAHSFMQFFFAALLTTDIQSA